MLLRPASPAGSTEAAAVNPRMQSVRIRTESIASLTSCDSIFLPSRPEYGRPIRPAMNTDSDDEQEHAVEARADPAEDDLARGDVGEWHETADGRVGSRASS